MSNSVKTHSDFRFNSAEAIEERLAEIARMQRKLENTDARTRTARKLLH
jgi:hypothetical protein